METVADVIGALVIIYGAVTVLGGAAQFVFSRKVTSKHDRFDRGFRKAGSAFSGFALLIGAVIIVGGYFITRIQ